MFNHEGEGLQRNDACLARVRKLLTNAKVSQSKLKSAKADQKLRIWESHCKTHLSDGVNEVPRATS